MLKLKGFLESAQKNDPVSGAIVMRFWLSFLVAVVSSSNSAHATTVLGVGNYSCATWLSASKGDELQTINWIGGYWSGANAMNNVDHNVGYNTDANGIIGEIKLYCSYHPSSTILGASIAVYDRMARIGARK